MSDNKFLLTISDVLNKIFDQVQEVNISNKVSEDKNSMYTRTDIYCKNDIIITYTSVTQIQKNLEVNTDYENSNKIILNDLTEQQLKSLYNQIIELLPSIYNEKKEILLR